MNDKTDIAIRNDGDLREMCEHICNDFSSENDKGFLGVAQKINDYLLNATIKVGNINIEPLWVETYFDVKESEEHNSHTNDLQRNRFGRLYFHRKGRGGMDFVLSTNDKYFSVLIKAACIEGNGYSQIYVKKKLEELEVKDDLNFTTKRNSYNAAKHLSRVNVKYRESLELAAYSSCGKGREGQKPENAYRSLLRRCKANSNDC